MISKIKSIHSLNKDKQINHRMNKIEEVDVEETH